MRQWLNYKNCIPKKKMIMIMNTKLEELWLKQYDPCRYKGRYKGKKRGQEGRCSNRFQQNYTIRNFIIDTDSPTF
jgi:hypothetical protein